jgi:hypothetical protein
MKSGLTNGHEWSLEIAHNGHETACALLKSRRNGLCAFEIAPQRPREAVRFCDTGCTRLSTANRSNSNVFPVSAFRRAAVFRQ